MVLSISSTAVASESIASLSEVSEAYGIPMDILKSLDKETIKSYRTNVANEKYFSSNETYIKVTIDENNEMHMEESSLSEYLMESQLMKSDTGVSINSSTNTNRGWINIFTSVFERTATTGRATASFTWLTPHLLE